MDDSGMVSLLPLTMNALKALREDYAAGYMRSVAEMIHGDVFSNFLEMAAYLDQSKYSVAAAVIAGTVLEEHVRKLCDKNSIARTDANGRSKSVETLNVDLAKASVYAKPMQMQVTAWYAIRNAAAHGTMKEPDYPSVSGMIAGIQQFLAMYPA